MKFSLVIPCYNEAECLPLLLERCLRVTCRSDCEVVLVDNGSSDDSPKLLRQLLPRYPGCRSVRVDENQGYGFGILSGLAATRGDIVGWTHADMQTDPQDAHRGLDLFERFGENILVKGRRYGRPIADVALTVGMSIFETCLLVSPLWDINAQPTMFSRKFLGAWRDGAPHDFSLDLYVYYHAKRTGLDVHRIPVRVNERAHGVSRWNVGWAAKRRLIRKTVEFSLQLKEKTR